MIRDILAHRVFHCFREHANHPIKPDEKPKECPKCKGSGKVLEVFYVRKR